MCLGSEADNHPAHFGRAEELGWACNVFDYNEYINNGSFFTPAA